MAMAITTRYHKHHGKTDSRQLRLFRDGPMATAIATRGDIIGHVYVRLPPIQLLHAAILRILWRLFGLLLSALFILLLRLLPPLLWATTSPVPRLRWRRRGRADRRRCRRGDRPRDGSVGRSVLSRVSLSPRRRHDRRDRRSFARRGGRRRDRAGAAARPGGVGHARYCCVLLFFRANRARCSYMGAKHEGEACCSRA